MISVDKPVVSYPNTYYGTTELHFPLTTVNIALQRNETKIPDTKNHASHHNHPNVTEFVMQACIFVLFGIAVVLLLTIVYVYIRQKMHEAQPF